MLFGLKPTRNPRLHLLKKVALFQDLSPRELGVVNHLLHARNYLADEVVFDQGEEGQGLFIVLSGRIKIVRPDNPDDPLLEFGPGSFFGEVALLDESLRTAQARAVEDSQMVSLFRAEFFSLLQTHSAIASRISFQLARVLAGRLRQAIIQNDHHHDAS